MRARFLPSLFLLALVPFAAAGEPPAPKPAPTPKIIVAPGGQQPAPTPTPTPAPPSPIPTSIKLSGMECEFLTLTGAGTTAVTWDVTSPDGAVVPVKLFECKPKSSIPAWRVGATEPLSYDVGDLPTVQVFAVGSGRATLAAWGVADGKPVKLATFAIEANTGPRPPPDPGPGPGPGPNPPPPPGPAPDLALVAKFRDALTVDIAKGATKAKAADLAVVFDSGASLLDLNDPAIAPKTVGELYSKMVLASVAKGIPRLPYLEKTRSIIDANTPLLNGTTELTATIKADFQAKYRAVAAALTEASK